MNEQKHAPFCHTFTAAGRTFAFDVHTSTLLEIDPALAGVLAGRDAADDTTARTALAAAQENEGLFLGRRPALLPAPAAFAQAGECDSHLSHLVLSVTERCNLRCRYCMHGADLPWMREHGEAVMSTATALTAAAYFLERRDPDLTPLISFYGGEALLETDLIAAVTAFVRGHPQGQDTIFSIDTNGVLLDAGAVELVLAAELRLQISLDGPAVLHDRHRTDRAGRGSHARIMAGLDRLLARDSSVHERLTFTATLAPPVDLPAVAAYFRDFPPYRKHGLAVQPSVVVNFANLNGQDWPGAAADRDGAAAQLAAARRQYLTAVRRQRREELSPVIRALFEPELVKLHHRSRAPLGTTFTPGGNCRPGRRKLHVTAAGLMQPCERVGATLAVGNLHAGIEPARVRALHEGFHAAVGERCRACWALRLCGVCFAHWAEFGKPEEAGQPLPEAVCASIRRAKEDVLKMMVLILDMPAECRRFLDDARVV